MVALVAVNTLRYSPIDYYCIRFEIVGSYAWLSLALRMGLFGYSKVNSFSQAKLDKI